MVTKYSVGRAAAVLAVAAMVLGGVWSPASAQERYTDPQGRFIEVSHEIINDCTVRITLRNRSQWVYPVSVYVDAPQPLAELTSAPGPAATTPGAVANFHSYGPTVDHWSQPTPREIRDGTASRTLHFVDGEPHTVQYRVEAGTSIPLYFDNSSNPGTPRPAGLLTTVQIPAISLERRIELGCIPEQPAPTVSEDVTTTVDCETEVATTETETTTTPFVYQPPTYPRPPQPWVTTVPAGSWVAGTPEVDTTQTSGPATPAVLNDADCPPPPKPDLIEEVETETRVNCDEATRETRTVTTTVDWVYDEATRTWSPDDAVITNGDWVGVPLTLPEQYAEECLERPAQPPAEVEVATQVSVDREAGVRTITVTTTTTPYVWDAVAGAWVLGTPVVTVETTSEAIEVDDEGAAGDGSGGDGGVGSGGGAAGGESPQDGIGPTRAGLPATGGPLLGLLGAALAMIAGGARMAGVRSPWYRGRHRAS